MTKTDALLSIVLVGALAGCAGGSGGGSGSSGGGGAPVCSLDFVSPNYARSTDPGSGKVNTLVWWARYPLKIAIKNTRNLSLGGGATLSTDTIVRDAVDRWIASTGGAASVTYVAPTADWDITVEFADIPSRPGSGSTLGFTRSSYIESTRELVSAEITINLWPGMTRDEMADRLRATTTHEFGHATYIFGHSPDALDLMHPWLPLDQDRLPTTRDTNTLFTAYCGDFTRSPRDSATRARGAIKTVIIECKAHGKACSTTEEKGHQHSH